MNGLSHSVMIAAAIGALVALSSGAVMPAKPASLLPDGAALDTLTWIFCEQALHDSSSLHPQWASDFVDHYVLDTDGSHFAYTCLRRDMPDTTCFAERGTVYMHANSTLPYSAQRYCAFWYPLHLLPSDITITEAKLCFFSHSYVTFPGVTNAWAVLDTLTADEKWLQATSCNPTSPSSRATSWRRTGAPDSSAWVPMLDRRDDSHDWGVKGAPTQTPWVAGGAVELDVTEPMQHQVKYRHANGGIWPFSNRGTQVIGLCCGRDCPDERRPFLKIRFVSKRYVFPWNDHPLAFVVTTDDQDSINVHYTRTLDSLGYKLTLFVRGDVQPFSITPSPSKLTMEQLRSIREHGHEIGHHSLEHLATYGIGEITPSGVDSMYTELDRSWLADALPASAEEIRAFAYPAGGFNMLGIRTLNEIGYLGSRCAGTVGTAVPVWSDADGSNFLTWTDTCNVFTVERLIASAELFGLASEDTITSTTLREKLYDVINKAVTYNHAVILFYLHDSKTSLTFAHGADADEFSWVMHHVKNHGRLWVTTFSELLAYYRAHHTPCPPPSFAVKSRLAGVTAEDGVWWSLGAGQSPTGVTGPGIAPGAHLGTNAPNPFNAKTTLRYSLPRPGPVALRIYDLRGRIVRTLLSEWQGAGDHAVSWDGRDDASREIPSGVYLQRLTFGGKSTSKKIAILK